MYPHERSLVTEMKNKPFALIGVNSDNDLEKIRATIKKKEINWRSFQNAPTKDATKISTTWAVRGWPTIVILDETMRVRYRGHDGTAAIKLARELVKNLK